jgi:hypothetical protein
MASASKRPARRRALPRRRIAADARSTGSDAVGRSTSAATWGRERPVEAECSRPLSTRRSCRTCSRDSSETCEGAWTWKYALRDRARSSQSAWRAAARSGRSATTTICRTDAGNGGRPPHLVTRRKRRDRPIAEVSPALDGRRSVNLCWIGDSDDGAFARDGCHKT